MRVRILILLLFLCGVAVAVAAPKLIVTISVEDMDAKYLKEFESEFTKGGFKRVASGERYEKVEFDYITSDYAADMATIYTGSNPCINGVIGKRYFNIKENKELLTLSDNESYGLNDGGKLSGKNIHATTFADKLYESTYGLSKIISIATDPTVAMVMAGHSGLPVYMNNLTGEWSTSSYYKDALPEWLTTYNAGKPVEAYLDKDWENLLPAGYYVMAARKGGVGFRYSVRGVCNGLKMYDNFTTMPQCNDYICDLALKAIEGEKMGNDLTTDLLMINFSLKKFYLKSEDPYSLELEDAYLRLDKTLSRLLENIENKLGKENIKVVLIGSRTGEINTTSGINPRVKYEAFNIDRYMALLNSYLMAHFGQKRWVLYVGRGNIYLNHSEIDKAGLKLKEVQEKAMEFFYLIPGVQNLCTSYQMESAFYSTGVLRYAYYRTLSGDLLYSLMPRWYEVNLKEVPNGYFSSDITTVPAWIYGGGHPDATIGTIKATELLDNLR